ncbi:MAG: indolepyruvate ferredoxin oxidoreductase subunit alpha [Methanobacteriaceae archaeon]|nr:indolepyruvate ferredoxin oxidoreductase subunit alpha [Methanobacteriaceae archaeon]
MNINDLLIEEKNKKLFMLGNEAAVRGVLESGISLAATYPGTPSSEIGDILSKIAKESNIYFEFSTNEKVAVEVAASAASTGLKTFTFMKHVGLNVASDSVMTTAYNGVEGGLVILVADDPSTFSSQNEQDTRHFARQSNIPLIEPSNPQEIKDMIKYAYELSTKYNTPIIIRTTTRVSHMRGIVTIDEYTKNTTSKGLFKHEPMKHVPVPEAARKMHKKLVEKIEEIREESNNSSINQIINNNGEIGVITSGGAYNYVADVIKENNIKANILKIGLSHPFPEDLTRKFLEENKEILVIEEVDPIMEYEVLAIAGKYYINTNIHGKKDNTLPLILEYTPDIVLDGIKKLFDNLTINKPIKNTPTEIQLPTRPATLCSGCPHRAAYYAATTAIKKLNPEKDTIYPTDIGCYTLGIAPPYEAANYLLAMGSSIGTSCGFSKSTDQEIISFIGDSTFFHGGIPPLINAVHSQANFTLVILDNRITAMTGGQTNPGIPIDGMGQEAPAISIEKILKALDIKFIETINPLNVLDMIDIFKKALDYEGVSVIISKYPCNLINKKAIKDKNKIFIEEDKCILCQKCLNELACPSMSLHDNKIEIDNSCTKCGVCIQVCPTDTIKRED